MQIPKNYKLFYNPVWMPTEEEIELFACVVPETAVINDVETHLIYLLDRYKSIVVTDFEENGKKTFDWYHEFVDANYWYQDEQDLVHCLFSSDLFSSEIAALKLRANQNVMPVYVIGTEVIELEDNWYNLLELLHLRQS